MVAGFALEWSGFDPHGEQTELVRSTITTFMTVFPALGAGLSMLVLLGFRLTEEEHARILDELDRRRTGRQ